MKWGGAVNRISAGVFRNRWMIPSTMGSVLGRGKPPPPPIEHPPHCSPHHHPNPNELRCLPIYRLTLKPGITPVRAPFAAMAAGVNHDGFLPQRPSQPGGGNIPDYTCHLCCGFHRQSLRWCNPRIGSNAGCEAVPPPPDCVFLHRLLVIVNLSQGGGGLLRQ